MRITKSAKSAKTFTLTSGYDNTNAAFVNIKTAKGVGADPCKMRTTDMYGKTVLRSRHICD